MQKSLVVRAWLRKEAGEVLKKEGEARWLGEEASRQAAHPVEIFLKCRRICPEELLVRLV
jgi:hypothetical protein